MPIKRRRTKPASIGSDKSAHRIFIEAIMTQLHLQCTGEPMRFFPTVAYPTAFFASDLRRARSQNLPSLTPATPRSLEFGANE